MGNMSGVNGNPKAIASNLNVEEKTLVFRPQLDNGKDIDND